MRQSLSENRSTYTYRPEPTTRGWRAAARAVLLAIVLSAVLVVVAIIDQTGGRSLADHAATVYAPYGKRPDPSLLYGLVYAVAAIGALLWLLVLRVVRSRGRSAPILTVVVTTVTAALALLLLVSSEYGAQIFPPLWGVLAVLPAAAGILAAVLLRRRSGRAVLRQRAHVRDVVLGHRSPEHRGALLVGGAAAPERLDGRPRLPALEYVDTARVHQIRGDGEVEAAGCEAGLFHHAHAARKVGLPLLRVDDEMPRDDYHVLSLR